MRKVDGLFLSPKSKKEVNPNDKTENPRPAPSRKGTSETQLAQEQHKLERLENRKKYLEKGEAKAHPPLCNLGGTIESLAPEVKDLTRTEMTELMEQIFSLSEVSKPSVTWRLPTSAKQTEKRS